MLEIKPNADDENDDLLVWITEPGEEYYLHMSLWRDVPFTFKLDANTESFDITVKKVVKRVNEACNSDENYNYIGSRNFYSLQQPLSYV